MKVTHARCIWLATECTVLFGLVPIVMFTSRGFFATLIIPTILVGAGGCVIALLRDDTFRRHRLFNRARFGRGVRATFVRFVPSAIALALAFRLVRPDLWLGFPTGNPRLWAAVMVLYPLLSVYPQEIIFRTFFLHRYRPLFGSDRAIAAASAAAFGLAHLFFANPLAPILSAAGGWLFARTFQRTDSTLQAVIDHGLWGDFVFTVGLGWYFWGGSIQ